MEKPLYILIFLLLWSTRIRGGEEEDIDGTLSPSTQKNGDRNSLIDKASSSTITKTSTIFDPDSESSETESSKTESPPIKSKALETNTGTEEPSVANYVTPKPARDSTIANTTTLTIPYSDSSEIQSPTIKPEALKTTKASTRTGTKTTLSNLDLESSETDLASTKSEATEIKPESLETDSPPDKSKAPRTNTDSTTAKTTSLSNSDSESSNAESPPIKSEAPDTKPASTAAKARTAIIGNPDSENTEQSVINFETNGSTKEPLVPDSPTIRSKAQETKTASTKTATKPATTSNIDLESSETDSASIKSKAQETEIDTQAPSVHNFESPEPANASTLAKSKTTTMRDADSESSETDSPPIESETPKTKIGIESTPVKSRTTRTTHENHHQESSLFQTKTSRATTDIKPQNQPPKGPNCTEIKNIHFVNQTATNLTLDFNLLPETARKYLCVMEQYKKPNNTNCTAIEQPTMIFGQLNASTEYHFLVFSYVSNSKTNQILSNNSCQIMGYTAPKDPNCTDIKNTKFLNQTAISLTLDFNLLPETARKHLCVKELYKPNNTNCTAIEQPTMIFGQLNASTGYHFSVFSYVSNNKTNQLLSNNSCQIMGYTAPKDPNCTEVNNTKFLNQTAISLTLDFKLLPETARTHLCVKELYKPNNTNCTAIEHPTRVFHQLNASTGYHFSVFSYVSNNNTNQILSNNSCQIMGYTGPADPNCSLVSIANKTATSLLLRLKTKQLIGDIGYIAEVFQGSDLERKTILNMSNNFLQNITNLTSRTPYTFTIFSVNHQAIESVDSCQLKEEYTLPSNPECEDVKDIVLVLNRNNATITLSMANFSESIRKQSCIKMEDKQDDIACKPAEQNVLFENLTPSTPYNFSLFSYVKVPGQEKLISNSGCPFSKYTSPSDPVCGEIILIHTSATNIKLNFSTLPTINKESLCVEVQLKQNYSKCKSIEYPAMSFKNLEVDTGYNFSVFSYLNDTDGKQVLSQSSCQIRKYTGPSDPNCTFILISNKTTDGMVINLQNLQTRGAASYILKIFNGIDLYQTLTKLSNRLLQHITNLTAGTSYTLKIYAVSRKNITSTNSCNIENVYTYPDPPKQPAEGDIVVKGETYLKIKWDRPNGGVDGYNITVHCNCSCTPNYTDSVTKTEVNVTQLQPGTHCSFLITTISRGLISTPLKYQNIETTETVPGEVSYVKVTAITSTNFTITWDRPAELNGDLRNYSVIISNETYNKKEEVLTTNMSFTNLNPGLCFTVTIAAVNGAGKGKEKNITVYTKEQIPSEVSDMELANTSSTSISVMWSKPLYPNGVITQYTIIVEKVQGNNTSTKQRIYLSCVDCQRSCPNAESFDKSRNAYSDDKKQIDKIEAGVMRHDVKFIKSNQTMHYEITELDIFTEYSITVNALTEAGLGRGKNGKITTSEDKPSTPGQPVINDVQINSVSFSFKKPENENGVIANQEIEYTFKPYNVCSTDEFIKEQTENMMPEIKINTTNKQFSASLKNLKSYWKYTIRVRVSTYAGFSSYSSKTIIQTLPTTPNKVSNITAAQTFSRRIELTWTQPCHPNGIIINYRVDVTNIKDLSTEIRYTNSNITSFSVTNLLPYRLYQFKVYTKVQNVSELSKPTNSIEVLTSTEAPFRPGNINVTSSSNSVNISWEPPKQETGPTRYLVKAIDKETLTLTSSCQTQGFYNTSCRIDGLDSYWNYSLTVQAIVGTFTPNESKTDVQTAQSAPGRVSYFTVTQDPNVTAKTNVHIEWRPPIDRDLNGILKNYYLQYWYQTNQKRIKSYQRSLTETTILVEAEKTYSFQIFAATIENASKADYVIQNLTIKPGAPLPPPKQKIPLINKGPPASDDQTQITVAFRQEALCDDSNGKIVKWYIIVSKMPGVKVFRGAREDYSEFIEKTYKKWGDVYENDVNIPYIASDSWNPHCESGSRRKRSVPRETVSYTLGSDGDCESGNRKYCNGNLEPGQTYRVRYAVCTAGGCLESEFSEPFQTAPNHVPAIAGSLTAVVLVLAVIIVVIIILKRRGKGPFKNLDNGDVGQQNEAFAGVEMKGTSKPKAVKIADFANYVQKLHADSNLLFSSEYKLLKETCPTHTTKAAEVQVNRIKNRYTNILSYDHSRVKLLPTEDDEGSDYINANYMPGYTSPREYIATQGPLPFTRDDFWRMIWEQNVSIIVMLTQLVERGRRKCDIYWPEASREPVYYGDLVVELESESTLPDYVLRVMSIKLGNRVRKVKQLHYLKWPDMGCPETTWLLLNFVGATRLYLPHNDPGPIVVHCSAGVGRTGTFIAVDYLMQHVRTSDVIDIYSYVMKMRNNRPNMVQTEDQYVFIHDCIKDYVNKNDDDTDDEEEEEEKQEDQSIYMNV